MSLWSLAACLEFGCLDPVCLDHVCVDPACVSVDLSVCLSVCLRSIRLDLRRLQFNLAPELVGREAVKAALVALGGTVKAGNTSGLHGAGASTWASSEGIPPEVCDYLASKGIQKGSERWYEMSQSAIIQRVARGTKG